MNTKNKRLFRRCISSVLTVAMVSSLIQIPVFAQPSDVYIPENEIGQDILSSDVFYLSSASAQLQEGANERYLLRIARGGDCTTASGVKVKISDLTAKYGEDYTISILGSDVEVDNPDDNESLLEKMEGEEYTESELVDEDKYMSQMEGDDELYNATVDAYNSAIEYIETESNVVDSEETDVPQSEQDTSQTEASTTDSSETVNTNPLQQARSMYTGVAGEPQNVTASTDTFQQIQQMANVITNAVVGATLTVDFAEGEKEKYIAINVNDNNDGDGIRYFYLMLAEPYGTTTNSAASSCALTILDDEEQDPSVIGFTENSYIAEGDTLTVEITREGALNTIAEAKLTTVNGSAQAGRDFSPVDMSVVFPMGIDKRTIEIPIRTDYFVGQADFGLKLESVNGSVIGTESVTVTMNGTAGDASDDSISLMGIEQSSRVTDIVLGDNINLSNNNSIGNSEHFDGSNNYEWGQKCWYMEWIDDSFWKNYCGTTGAGWNIANEGEVHIAGAQMVWERKGTCANIKVGFLSDLSLPWSYCNYPYGEESKGWVYNSRAYFGPWTTTNVFSAIERPARVTILSNSNCDDCNRLWIRSIKPIYRPFVVNLNNANQLEFLNADGTYSTFNDATFLAIAGANNDTNNQIIRYAIDGKNAITFQQTIGKNVSKPYTYLKNIKMENNGYTRTIANYNNDGATSQTITIDENWLKNNRSYIYFEENNASDSWKNQTGSFGLRGRIELKPEFGYKNAEVKINVPENNFGYFNISGTNMDITYSSTYTYHMGDILKLSTVMRDEYKDLYTPAGYMVSYKHNKSDTNWVKRDVIVPYNNEDGTSAFLDDNQRLRYGYYEITPLFTRNDNAIIVRVKEDNLWMYDRSYGIFTTPYFEHTEIDGVKYVDYIVYNKPQFGKIYSLAAQSNKYYGKNYSAYWKESGSDKIYTGEVFFHEASNDPQNNIVYLSMDYESTSDNYQDVSGAVFRPSYNMTTKQVGYSNMLPASGAIVNFGTSFAVVDQDGNFKLPIFKSPNDNRYSDKQYYIRYTIAYNGEESLREMRLSHTEDYKWQSHNFTVTDSEGNVSTKTESVCVNKINIGQQLINTENGSIINNIEVYTDATNQGYNLILDGDSIQIKARATSPVKYTKQSVNKDGTISEIKDADENVTGIEFVIYDASTNKEIASYPAEKKGDEFISNVSLSQALPGNRLYLKVTTDRTQAVYASYDENGNMIEVEGSPEMNSTTYADVFTGYTFTQKNAEDVPVLQHVDLPIKMDFLELPLVGNTGMAFDFPFISVGAIKTDTGYRMYIGVGVGQIADKVKTTHMTTYAGDTGAYYKDMFSIKNPISSFKDGLKTSYDNIFKDVPKLYDGATSALGAPTWKFDVQIGVYFDFEYMQIKNPNNGADETHCVFTGVGGYIGVSAGFKMAWYTILPVVFIPAYFGIEISGNVLGFFGAGTDTSKPKISYDEANNGTVNFDDKLGEFNASVQLGATVQVYVGVGLAGTLGLRGGGTFNAMGLWEPSELVSDWGCVLTFTAGIWIDLFLFSVPLQYKIAQMKFGSFEEYANLPDEIEPASLSSVNELPTFSLRAPYSSGDSVWLPDELSLMSGFNETSAQTIVENGYEHPDVQLIKLSDGRVFMAFLDNDNTRDALNRTVLKFATYQNGTWSEPTVVQNDGTADFQPSICEMDNGRVMISWLSYDPSTQITEDSANYLSKLEVYTAVIDSNGTVSEETRLTNDKYYDYTPISVYDDLTGDRVVYYVKTASSGTAEEMINSYTNDCVVVYMLYSSEQGRWLFDYYYDNEVASEDDKEILINEWHGQRFLSSPIPELGIDVPNISDFVATTYNGIAVYAYTIDQDSSNDTAYDKELFVQFYDFEQHKTYVPVRLSNDNASDSLPQFVRTGSGEEAETKLFWYRDDRNVAYIDLSSLIREGVDDNGQITDDYLRGDDGEIREIDALYSYVSPKADNYQGTRSMSDFKAITDGDDIYVVWTQPYTTNKTDEDGNALQCREVYATALIQEETAETSETAETEETMETDEAVGDNNGVGKSWADPCRLTYTNAFTDEPAAVIDNNGNMMVLYNQYNQEITDDKENPVIISDFKLRASYMEPCGAVDVTDISFSDDTPNGGDVIELNVSVKNTGLTYADGYSVNVYKMKDGIQGELIKEITSDNKLLPGNTDDYKIEWTVPEDYEGMSIYAVAQENGMDNISEFESEKLIRDAVYEVSNLSVYQDNEGYRVNYTVENTGNTVSTADDSFRVIFTGPYGMSWDYTEEECDFATISLEGIAVGERKTFDESLKIKPEIFDKYGFIDALGVCIDNNNMYLTDGEEIRIMAGKPLELNLNGEEFPESITINAGETIEFNVTCLPSILNNELKATFGTENESVATFDGTTLKGLHEGTTTIYGSVMPYGSITKNIEVTVVGNIEPAPTGKPSGGGGGGAITRDISFETNGGNKIDTIKVYNNSTVNDLPIPIKNGYEFEGWFTDAELTKPFDKTTRITADIKLYAKWIENPKAWSNPFSDVLNSDWFYENVKFVCENNIFNGITDTRFEPNTDLTRAMLVTVLYRLENEPDIENENLGYPFADVDAQSWYGNAVYWSRLNGIVNGYSEDEFAPNDKITREQFATIMHRYAIFKGNKTAEIGSLSDFDDANEISDWANESIVWAVGAGLLTGVGDGILAPKGNATRAQAAAILQRYIESISLNNTTE